MAVADMQLAADVLADSMHTILDVTHAQEAKAVARAWLARFGDAAAEASPEQLLQFVLVLAASGQRDAEGWLTKVNQAHPSPAPGLDALAHGVWAAYLPQPGQRRSCAGAQQAGPPGGQRRGRAGAAVPDARGAAPAGSRSAPAGRRPAGCGRRPPARHRAPVRLLSWMSSGHPPLRPGWHSCRATWSRPGRRWTGPPGLPRNTTPWRTGWDGSSPAWPKRESTWSGANTSPPRPC